MEFKVIRIKDEKTLVLQAPDKNYLVLNLAEISDEFRLKCQQMKIIAGTKVSVAKEAAMKIDDTAVTLEESISKTGETLKFYHVKDITSLDWV